MATQIPYHLIPNGIAPRIYDDGSGPGTGISEPPTISIGNTQVAYQPEYGIIAGIITSTILVDANDINSTGIITANSIRSSNINSTGIITANDINSTGIITANNVNVSGVLNVDNIQSTGGSLNLSNINSTGIITANNINSTGITTATTIRSSNINVTGIITSPNINVTGIITSPNINSTGIITANNINSTGIITANNINASGIVTASRIRSTGIVTSLGGYVGTGSTNLYENLPVKFEMRQQIDTINNKVYFVLTFNATGLPTSYNGIPVVSSGGTAYGSVQLNDSPFESFTRIRIDATYSQVSVYPGNSAATKAGMQNDITAETLQTGTDSHTSGDLAWVQMDFGVQTEFDRIVVGCDFNNTLAGGWGSGFTGNADIIGSNNLSSWTILGNTGTFTSATQRFTTTAASYRYVRLRRSGNLAVTEFYAEKL